MKEIPLAQLQQRFRDYLHQAEGEAPRASLLVRGTPTVPVSERLEIYHYAYWTRIESSMAEDYPELVKRVGRPQFSQWVRRFIETHPSTYASLLEASARFSDFLTGELPGKPFLGELARLEWLQTLAFTAVEPPPLDPTLVTSIPPENWPRVRFVLNPSVFFFESEWDVDRWRLKEESAERKPTKILVQRQEGWVVFKRPRARHWRLLKGLSERKTVGELVPLLEELRFSATEMTACFSQWMGQQIIGGVEVSI